MVRPACMSSWDIHWKSIPIVFTCVKCRRKLEHSFMTYLFIQSAYTLRLSTRKRQHSLSLVRKPNTESPLLFIYVFSPARLIGCLLTIESQSPPWPDFIPTWHKNLFLSTLFHFLVRHLFAHMNTQTWTANEHIWYKRNEFTFSLWLGGCKIVCV